MRERDGGILEQRGDQTASSAAVVRCATGAGHESIEEARPRGSGERRAARRDRRFLIVDLGRHQEAIEREVRQVLRTPGQRQRSARHPQWNASVVEVFDEWQAEAVVERLDHVEQTKSVGLAPR